MHPSTIETPAADAGAEISNNTFVSRCSAAAMYLMSQYTQAPCPLLAHAIADQLRMLSHLPATATNSALRSLAHGLLPRWQAIAAGSRGITH